MNYPSATDFFVSRLVNDRLGSVVRLNMQIINDNARGHIQFDAKFKVSNDKQDKARLRIASRWGTLQKQNVMTYSGMPSFGQFQGGLNLQVKKTQGKASEEYVKVTGGQHLNQGQNDGTIGQRMQAVRK
jgi:hypothetical protein